MKVLQSTTATHVDIPVSNGAQIASEASLAKGVGGVTMQRMTIRHARATLSARIERNEQERKSLDTRIKAARVRIANLRDTLGQLEKDLDVNTSALATATLANRAVRSFSFFLGNEESDNVMGRGRTWAQGTEEAKREIVCPRCKERNLVGGKGVGRMPDKKPPPSLIDGIVDKSDAAQEAGDVAKKPSGLTSTAKSSGARRASAIASSAAAAGIPTSQGRGEVPGSKGTTGGASSVGDSALGRNAAVVYDDDENSEADEREGMEDGSVACWNCRYSIGAVELGLVPYVACVQGSDVCIHRIYRTLEEAQGEYAERDIREADYLDGAADDVTMAKDALARRAARLKQLKEKRKTRIKKNRAKKKDAAARK